MSSDKKTSTREKAAAARAAAEASERRRDRAVKIGIGAGVVVIVGGIIGATLFATRDSGSASTSANPDAPLPAGVSAPEYGAPVGSVDTPVLDVYEDFQCPACAVLAEAVAPTIKEMADAGQVKVNYHPMNFLDRNLGNDASTRAASAFGCAVDAGVALDYHTLVFANQPSEGAGYTQEDLKKWGAEAGITGPALDTFNTCVDGVNYAEWPSLVNEAANLRGVTGTPTLFLNGEEVDRNQLASPDDLKAQILAAGGQ